MPGCKKLRASRKHRPAKTISPQSQEDLNDIQVVNMSAKVLTTTQTTVLSKRLSFPPTCRFNLYNTILDVNKFARDITILKHSDTLETMAQDQPATQMENVTSNDQMPEQLSRSFMFTDLMTQIQLQELPAESRELSTIQPSTTFRTTNREFYPVQSRTNSLELFQERMEQDLVTLYNSPNRSGHENPNLNHKERCSPGVEKYGRHSHSPIR